MAADAPAVTDPAAPAPAISTTSSLPFDDKVPTDQQLLNVERMIERNELWQEHLATRGLRLGDVVEHEQRCLRATRKTLLLLMEFERPFVAMVRREREASQGRRTSSDRYGTSRRAPTTL